MTQLKPGRRTMAALAALVAFECFAMAHQYFTEFPRVFDGDNPRGWDHGMGAAMRLAFAQRRDRAPMYFPPSFFDFDGIFVGFWGDLDPADMRAHGPAGSGVRATDDPEARTPLPAGTLWITEGSQEAPFLADVVGAIDRRPDSGGERVWTLYRKR